MAFPFQPVADSSDEGEVDITAWQGSAKRQRLSPHAPPSVALTNNSAHNGDNDDINVSAFQQRATRDSADGGAVEDHEDDEPIAVSIEGGSETSQAVPANCNPSQGPALAASGFTSINHPSRDVATKSEEIEVPTRKPRRKSKASTSKKGWKLIPAILRNEVDVNEYQDLTAGGDVVLRVKKEMPSKRGIVRYMVEFGDNTLQEVCHPLSSTKQADIGVPHGRPSIRAFLSVARFRG